MKQWVQENDSAVLTYFMFAMVLFLAVAGDIVCTK